MGKLNYIQRSHISKPRVEFIHPAKRRKDDLLNYVQCDGTQAKGLTRYWRQTFRVRLSILEMRGSEYERKCRQHTSNPTQTFLTALLVIIMNDALNSQKFIGTFSMMMSGTCGQKFCIFVVYQDAPDVSLSGNHPSLRRNNGRGCEVT